MKKLILAICIIVLMSSCASNLSHYQVRKGIYTKERKTPDCIQAWDPVSPYNQRGHQTRNNKKR